MLLSSSQISFLACIPVCQLLGVLAALLQKTAPSRNHQPEGCDLLAPLPPRKFHLGLSHPECKELVLLPPFRARCSASRDLAEAGLHLSPVPSLFLLPSLPFSWRVWPQIPTALETLLEAMLRAFKPRPPWLIFSLFYLSIFFCFSILLLLIALYLFCCSLYLMCSTSQMKKTENETLILNKCAEPALSGAGTCRHTPSNPAVRCDHLVGR